MDYLESGTIGYHPSGTLPTYRSNHLSSNCKAIGYSKALNVL